MLQTTKNKQLVGLTGGIASGKSTVARIFSLLNVPVYNSDLRAKQLIENNSEVKSAILSTFGPNSYRDDGSYNTGYIAGIVFQNKKELEKLNDIVHPAVFRDQTEWFSSLTSYYAMIESALLFEVGKQDLFDKLIVVAADDECRIKRIMQRDSLSKTEAQKRLNNQLPQQEKIAKADYVIWNNENESVIEQVMEIHQSLRL